MKKSVIVLGLLFVTVAASASFASDAGLAISPEPATFGVVSIDKEVLAAAGCCKERRSEGKPWQKTSKDLDSCKKLNAKRDGDNVFKASGKVWWDLAC